MRDDLMLAGIVYVVIIFHVLCTKSVYYGSHDVVVYGLGRVTV